MSNVAWKRQTEDKSSSSVLQAARIIAKLAAWGRDLMEGSDLNYYFNWIKSQLSSQVHPSDLIQIVAEKTLRSRVLFDPFYMLWSYDDILWNQTMYFIQWSFIVGLFVFVKCFVNFNGWASLPNYWIHVVLMQKFIIIIIWSFSFYNFQENYYF